jgi:hypothetical protein
MAPISRCTASAAEPAATEPVVLERGAVGSALGVGGPEERSAVVGDAFSMWSELDTSLGNC